MRQQRCERPILIASDAGLSIHSFKDVSDVIAACVGVGGLLLSEDDFGPDFFNLRTGLAGELFHKFMTYRMRVAIVVHDTEAYGERFSELAYEHATHSHIRIVRSIDVANAWLTR